MSRNNSLKLRSTKLSYAKFDFKTLLIRVEVNYIKGSVFYSCQTPQLIITSGCKYLVNKH